MTLRLEMLQAAGRAPELLGDSTPLVRAFLLSQQTPDGGFRNRGGNSDLYYLPFALGGLVAISRGLTEPSSPNSRGLVQVMERVETYLTSFANGTELDFVHLCCLVRSRAALSEIGSASGRNSESLLARVETYRTPDGGYNPAPGREFGTAYGAWLALGAYQDSARPVPDAGRLAESVQALRGPDGGYANERFGGHAHNVGLKIPTSQAGTNPTAAAVSVLRHLNQPVAGASSDWLRARACPAGGFVAAPETSAPDLLSTASALHALAGLGVPLGAFNESCLNFLDSLWSGQGGFYGHWADDCLDCEYAFYGLMALGHLAP